MAEPRPMASLTSGLLARKGAARPAMRSPLQSLDAAALRPATDDLGWNDFGSQAPVPAPEPAPEPTIALVPEIVRLPAAAPEVPAPHPVVHRQQDEIAARIGAVKDEREHAAPRRRVRATEQGRRAAFTLRLDGERHLSLRLAATISGRSAQQVVTEALDRFLAANPEVAALAAQIGQPVLGQPVLDQTISNQPPLAQRGNEK